MRLHWLVAPLLGVGARRAAAAQRPAVVGSQWSRRLRDPARRPEAGRAAAEGSGWRLRGGALLVEISVEETPVTGASEYPRRIRIEGRLGEGDLAYRDEYTLLAPAAPLAVEGFGLGVTGDPPGTNDAEHEALRAWLTGCGHAYLVSDVDAGSAAGKVQALLQQEAGRFAAMPGALPPPPIAGPGVRHARAEP